MKDFGKAIYIVIGLAAILVSYFLGYRTLSQKNTELQETVDELKGDYDRLKADYVNKDKYIEETKDFDKKYEDMLSEFDTTLLNEGQIMDVYNMQGSCGIQITQVTLTEPLETYAFDGSIQSELVTAAQMPQTNPDGTQTEPEPIVNTTTIDASYRGVSNSLQLMARGNYEGIKKMLETIVGDKKRKVPTSISFSFDSLTEEVLCNIIMNEYAITGKDREPKKVEITEGAIGRTNIFFDPLGVAAQAQ